MKRLLICSLFLVVGCARNPLPTFEPMPLESARVTMRDRSPGSFTLQGELILSRPGESVRLDAALVLKSPDHLRLRAWKFGQAVFDLTARPDGAFVFSGRKEISADELKRVAGSITQWLALLGPVPDDAIIEKESAGEWTLVRQIDSITVRSIIARATLVPTRHEILDEQGTSRARIELSQYALFESIPWPQTITVREQDRQIQLKTKSIKPDIAPRAFEPPRRAERITP